MRLKYASNHPRDPNEALQKWIDALVASQGSRGVDPLFRTLLISPPFAHGFSQFFRRLRWDSTLPEDVKELAMCRVGALNGAAFEWMHHVPLLQQAGVSEAGCETVRSAPPGKVGRDGEGGLSQRLWTVLHYVDAMTKDIKVPDEVFEGVKQALEGDERKILELTLTVAGYNAVSRCLVALDVAELKDVPVGKAKL